MQNNPQLAQVLNDPATMRQYLDMARNPEVRFHCFQRPFL